ncbi:MAG: c-type cytochrome [Pseudomonadota bacterium]
MRLALGGDRRSARRRRSAGAPVPAGVTRAPVDRRGAIAPRDVRALIRASAQAQNMEARCKKAEARFACHGVSGNSAVPQFPMLAGQTARFLYLQLKDFKEGRRVEPTMAPFVKNLSCEGRFDLAAFFAAQPGVQGRPGQGRARAEQGRGDAVHDVPSRRLRGTERNPARCRAARRVRRQALR